jgi:hypothetical protein
MLVVGLGDQRHTKQRDRRDHQRCTLDSHRHGFLLYG